MQSKGRVPEDFYKLFSSKYTEYYQLALIAIYEESGASYSLLGLTEEECQEIIREKMESFTWDQNPGQPEEEDLLPNAGRPSFMLRRLVAWGWVRRDYDETLNQYVLSIPDYSQMFIDVFRRLFDGGDSRERASILTVYSHLFTDYSDKEQNNEILKSALWASKSLQQMLSDMQEGIRGYFEELAGQKTFLGIQKVLVDEINNRDSKKYAILTTTDSFYRYKEEIKELLDQNLGRITAGKQRLAEEVDCKKGKMADYEEALELLFRISREFEGIEKRYNQLIDQKREFAKRAAARIRYILTEGDAKVDRATAFVRFLDQSAKKEEILEEFAKRLKFTEPFHIIKEKSFARPRNTAKHSFCPQAVEPQDGGGEDFGEFVVKPLYTHAQIARFWEENETDGVFLATGRTVHSVEDLEKLLFVWQEAAELPEGAVEVEPGEVFTTPEGFRYSGFLVRRENKDG